MDVLDAVQPVVVARQRPRIDQSLPQRLVEDLRRERALTRARGAGDGDEHAEWNRHVDGLQVVGARSADEQDLPIPLAPLGGKRDRPLAGEELAGRRRSALDQFPDRPLGDHGPSVDTWSGPHLDDMVGRANRVFVMLDDDDGVANVAQSFERRDHLGVVLRMEANAGLVEHVKHAHQAGSDLSR